MPAARSAAAGTNFEALSQSERHDVRIALERLRYALGGVCDGEQKKKLVRRSTRLRSRPRAAPHMQELQIEKRH
jgi:hypothetical protein